MSTHPANIKKQQKLARLIKKGKLREAVQTLRPLCKQQPRDTQNWMSLASLYGQLGDYQGVLDTCRQVVRLQPQMPVPYSLMGNALSCLGRFEEAGHQYKKAMELQPNDPGILNNLGNALYLEGKLEEAADILQQAVTLRPGYADAHNNLGNIYKALNDNDLAIQHYQRAIQINPALFEAHLNLGDIFISRIGHPEAAEHHYRQASLIKPDDTEARTGIVNVLRYQGKLEEALKIIRDVQLIHPNDVGIAAKEADILERQGNHKAAHQLARRLADEDGANPMVADVLMRVCKHFDDCEDAGKYAEHLLKDPTVKSVGQETLHFGLGKLYDRLGSYDDAFLHYQAANEVLDIPFEPGKFSARVARLMQAFGAANLTPLPRSSLASTQPIFIVGMPRSGTSLTEQILASHPDVAGAGELNEINDIVASLKVGYPENIANLSTEDLDKLARRYLDFTDAFRSNETFVTDKMPHNFLNLGFISLLFPNCRIIHCTRDPRDNCLSIYFQSFGWLHAYGRRLEWLGSYYRDYLKLMKHWESVLATPILTLRYEDLVEDQEGNTRKLLEFCGLEWNDACLQFHKSERIVATASYDQVRQKIYKKSRARWKNYEAHIQPLIETLGDALNGLPAR